MRRALVAIALTGSLLASTGGRPVLFDQLWSFLSSIWDSAGCGWDPDGQCSPPPQSDAGCEWDPNGQCGPPPQTDEGCGWDPDGCPKGS
jgi:hypothetical protein